MPDTNPVRKLPHNRPLDHVRMHGLIIGAILFVCSVLVASFATAGINIYLLAVPLFALVGLVLFVGFGVPAIFTRVQAAREAMAAAGAHDNAMLLSLEGFWKHAHKVHPHFVSFQPIDHDIVIHLDSKSDDNPITMGEFIRMTSGSKGRTVDVEKSLEGLTDYRRV